MFTLYSADFIGNPGNCSYPHKTVVMDADRMRDAVSHDYVCAEYKNHYRNSDNFLSADCLPVDCDNDHSEDPKDWITPADVLEAFPGVSLAIHYSRFNQREKNGKPARPKFHVLRTMCLRRKSIKTRFPSSPAIRWCCTRTTCLASPLPMTVSGAGLS